MRATVFLYLVAAVLPCTRALAEERSTPLWSLDLPRLAEYQPYAKVAHQQVTFTNSATVAVSFLAAEPNRLRLRLVCLFMDTRTGKLKRVESWSTPYRTSPFDPPRRRWITRSTGATFIVFTGDMLRLFSDDIEQRAGRTISTDPIKASIATSPNGQQLLLTEFISGGNFRETILRVRDFAVEEEFYSPMPSEAISGEGRLLRFELKTSGCLPRGGDRSSCGGVPIFGRTDYICEEPNDCRRFSNQVMGGGARFLDEDHIFASDVRRGVFVLDRAGKILFRVRYKDSSEQGGAQSADSSLVGRFSFGASYLQPPLPDWRTRFYVFDLNRGKTIFRLYRHRRGGVQSPVAESAISPDGTHLVVLFDNNLQLFDLPR